MTEEELTDAIEEQGKKIAELRSLIAQQKSEIEALLKKFGREVPTQEIWNGKTNSLGAKNGLISDLHTEK